jgi:RNA polymerase sigma-70 factor (family 1)
MNNLPDNQLFSLVQRDDQRAFATIFDRHKNKLFNHIYSRTQSVFDTEEIMQNIFISLWNNRMTVVIEDSVLPYLLGAARNSVLQFYLQNKHSLAIRSLSELEQPSVYTQEDYMFASDLESFIDHTVSKMPDTMRKSFELSRKENLSVKEIAEQMELSEQTVKNNLSMALQRLRLKLNDNYMFPLLLTGHLLSSQIVILLIN